MGGSSQPHHVVEEVHHRFEVAGAGVHLHVSPVEVLKRGILFDEEALLEVRLVYRVNLLVFVFARAGLEVIA